MSLLTPILGYDLRECLLPATHPAAGEREVARRKQTSVVQPLTFVLEYALAQLLMQWGIRPQALLGYSLGEYVAACLAGVFTLEDALRVVARRAHLIQALPTGAMLAVALSEQEVQPYLSEQVSLAAINAPRTCVLAGSLAAIAGVEAQLSQREIVSRRVEAEHAFHSPLLQPVQAGLLAVLQTIPLHAPCIPCISTVTGTWMTAEQATSPQYWAEQMCQPVRFADGVQHVLDDGASVVLEVGGGQALCSFVKQHPSCDKARFSLVLPTLSTGYEQPSGYAGVAGNRGQTLARGCGDGLVWLLCTRAAAASGVANLPL